MTTREDLRQRGRDVVRRLQHGANPPRPRPLYLGSIPGMEHFTSEALWGAVWARPGLELRHRMLATLAILSSLQRLPQLRTYINSALNIGLDPGEIREVFIQCALYAGFPTTVNSLELARDIFEQRGIEVQDPDVPEVPLEELEARGRALRDRLLDGEDRGGYVAPVDELAPDLRRIAIQYGFGEIYHRPGLDIQARAVCTIASLVALRAEAQLRNWLRGGLRAGLTRDQIVEVLMHSAYYAGFPAALSAVAVAADALPHDG